VKVVRTAAPAVEAEVGNDELVSSAALRRRLLEAKVEVVSVRAGGMGGFGAAARKVGGGGGFG